MFLIILLIGHSKSEQSSTIQYSLYYSSLCCIHVLYSTMLYTYASFRFSMFVLNLASSAEVTQMDFTTAKSLTQGMWSLGGATGSQIGGLFGLKIGRKRTLLLNNIFIISGLLLQVSFL